MTAHWNFRQCTCNWQFYNYRCTSGWHRLLSVHDDLPLPEPAATVSLPAAPNFVPIKWRRK